MRTLEQEAGDVARKVGIEPEPTRAIMSLCIVWNFMQYVLEAHKVQRMT